MKPMKPVKYFLSIILLYAIFSCSNRPVSNEGKIPAHPNILFICIDDLRPELGCYGADYIHSPNIDKLAETGAVFTNHYVHVPTCGASRFSLLTGMLPKTKGHLSNEACHNFIAGKPETEVPETFIHHLRRNGYYTVGIGKISHYVDGLLYGYTDSVGTEYELPHSWDEMLLNPGKWGTGWNAFFGYADGENRQSMKNQVKPYEMADVPDSGYPDGLIAEQALEKIKELAKNEKPFFLSVGFFKPHLPFNAPKKYWDMYDENEIPLSPNPFIPENVNKESLHGSGEFNGYKLGDEAASLEGPVSDEYARKLRHAYFACVSYVDAQVGKLIEELEKQDLAENTVVVIWGDHGWHLGDQLIWGKHTIFERALKSAFIVNIPGKTNGKNVEKIVSTVDIYPTILELCNMEMPHNTDGKSLVPLIENPISEWEDASFGYFRDGISLRTEQYRFTRYFRNQEPVTELYDHHTDPNETKNIAAEHPEIIEKLLPLWEKGNTGLFYTLNN
jgi:choline-sulfatase